MEPFKSFKNYLLASTGSSASSQSTSILTNIENQTTPGYLSRSSSDSSEDKNRFSLFRKSSTKSKQQRGSGKFLHHSKSSGSDSDSIKSANLKDTSPKNTDLKDDRRELFHVLGFKLNELIEHFKNGQLSFESPLIEKNTKDRGTDTLFYSVSPAYLDTSDTSAHTYFKLTTYAKKVLTTCQSHYDKIEPNLSYFDLSPDLPSSGYRTLLAAFEACCRRLLLVVNQLNDTKSSFLFQFKLNTTLPGTLNIKDFQTWIRLLEKIEIILQIAVDIQSIQLQEMHSDPTKYNLGPSLFYNMAESSDPKNSSIETNLLSLGSVHQEAFFGRTCGFQFCESLQTPLTGCAVALASYNDGYEANALLTTVTTTTTTTEQSDIASTTTGGTTFMQGQATLFKSLVSGTKYVMDPELRAKKISKVMKDANVEFCKAFWQLTETDIVQMGSNMITPNVTLNILKKISLSKPLELPNTSTGIPVTINPPQTATSKDTIQIRVLSNDLREGMQHLDETKPAESAALFNNLFQTNSRPAPTVPKSQTLILHVHGGGFIAHSSKSHEIYLKPWCKELKIPIVSIDYSLAPEHIFPRASEECFYVYAWCLLNKDILGWTGSKIILVGDSAGGLLSTNIVQRAILNQIRVPDALIPIYTPFLSSYTISPSRLMSVMDPLLNLGVLWRCLAAYSGIDYKKETEKFKSILDLFDNKVSSNSEVKTPVMRTSPSISSILKTTPFKSFLSRSSTQSPLAIKEDDSPPVVVTSTEVNIRYSKRESFDLGPNTSKLATEEIVNIETVDSKENIEPVTETEKVGFELESSDSEESKSPDPFDSGKLPSNSNNDQLTSKQKQRLLQLHKVLGDSVFLIERLRNHPLAQNQFMSPLLSDNSTLAKFPSTYLIACNDPCLDDSIEMARRLGSLGVNYELIVANNGVPHGFLNIQDLTTETQEACQKVLDILHSVIKD